LFSGHWPKANGLTDPQFAREKRDITFQAYPKSSSYSETLAGHRTSPRALQMLKATTALFAIQSPSKPPLIKVLETGKSGLHDTIHSAYFSFLFRLFTELADR
jgi:hypothetical protein